MINTEQAVWKTYPEIPFIQANQFGEVRTIDRVVVSSNGRKYHIKGRILKQKLNPSGYMQVQFRVNGKGVILYVHRIVAVSFIPNPDNLPEVNHKDNDRTNNAVSNLEWCTRKYNNDYKKNFGTSPTEVQGRPVVVINQENGEVFWFESQHEAARQLMVDVGHINEVVKGKRKKTGGYWFTYADLTAVEKTRENFGDDIANKAEKLMNEHRN